jgi:hypothetical protein
VIGSFESPEITPLQVYAPPLPETREKFEEFVFGRFCIALDSPGRYAGATEDRIELGLASIPDESTCPRCAHGRKPSATCVAVATK